MKPIPIGPARRLRTRVGRRPQRAWPRAPRTAAAILATAGLTLSAPACGSGSPSSAGSAGPPAAAGSASTPSAVAYSHCMRSHGVPNFPDPGSSGQIPKGSAQQFGVSTSQLQTAQTACQDQLPTTGSLQQQAQQCVLAGDCPPAVVQQMLTSGRRFAACMRSHGVLNWPDPTIDTGAHQGVPFFNLSAEGIDDHSPQVSPKMAECARLTGGVSVPEG